MNDCAVELELDELWLELELADEWLLLLELCDELLLLDELLPSEDFELLELVNDTSVEDDELDV